MDAKPFIYQIKLYPNPILTTKCEPVLQEEMTDEFKQLVKGIFPLLAGNNGYALAANQLGIFKRFFVMEGETDKKLICFNPEIISKKGENKDFEECLSIPTVSARMTRAETVEFQYRDLNWELQTKTYSGIEARVIQHELDHLDGMLFITKLTPANRSMVSSRLHLLEKVSAEAECLK